MVKVLMTAGIVLLIAASLVEVAADVRGSGMPEFLPAPLSGLPSSHPATALGVAGFGALVIGFLLQIISNPLPGGRVIVGSIAVLAFLLSGGYVAEES
ncbi:hypothetical protein ACFR9U_13160 [Halorientalis brevis]|uniref:Cox cluster protein n=1 Tax=Halorientalis brevis TaxID=1126241 RepID=A0ABD6CD25_9EURY|nr:hypothetical protein [Halorientalis brevis]